MQLQAETTASSLQNLDTLLVHINATSALASVSAGALIASFDTDDLAEGSAKYFTDALAQAAVAGDIATAVGAEATIARAAEVVNANAIAAEATRARAAENKQQRRKRNSNC